MEFEKHLYEIEKKIGYTFSDKRLLRQAFTRTSYCNEKKSRTGTAYQSNEVLEFFGDSVLSTAIVTLLMHDFSERYEYGIYTELGEGDFSNIRSKLSDKRNLARATAALGLQKFLLMGEGDAKLGIENEPSVMEDLFESIIGAIYIDCGMDIKTVISCVSNMLDVKEYVSRGKEVIQSYKNALQEWCADKNHRLPAPVYKTVAESGPDHKKIYERAVYIGDKLYATGSGKNQKLADAAAAENALKMLMKEAENKKRPKVSEDAIQKLKEKAQKEKKPTPEFRDLGESVRSTERAREYEIECRFMGKTAVGAAEDKRTAKARAAAKILCALEDGEKAEKKTAEKKTHRSTPSKKTNVQQTKKKAENKKPSSTEQKSNTQKRPKAKRKFNKV